jgi:hypothetical protein
MYRQVSRWAEDYCRHYSFMALLHKVLLHLAAVSADADTRLLRLRTYHNCVQVTLYRREPVMTVLKLEHTSFKGSVAENSRKIPAFGAVLSQRNFRDDHSSLLYTSHLYIFIQVPRWLFYSECGLINRDTCSKQGFIHLYLTTRHLATCSQR